VFVHCGQRGDLALFVERRADDLLQYVVADLLGLADLAGNRGAVPASLFRMSVDKGRRLLGRILRLSAVAGLRPSASGAPFRLRVLLFIESLALPAQRSAKRWAQFAPVEVLVDLDQLDRAYDLWRVAGNDAGDDRLAAAAFVRLEPVRPATRMGLPPGCFRQRWTGGSALTSPPLIVAMMSFTTASSIGSRPCSTTTIDSSVTYSGVLHLG
jgi:hypothetical protein